MPDPSPDAPSPEQVISDAVAGMLGFGPPEIANVAVAGLDAAGWEIVRKARIQPRMPFDVDDEVADDIEAIAAAPMFSNVETSRLLAAAAAVRKLARIEAAWEQYKLDDEADVYGAAGTFITAVHVVLDTPSLCPTCGSDDQAKRRDVPGTEISGFRPQLHCTNPWHDRPAAGSADLATDAAILQVDGLLAPAAGSSSPKRWTTKACPEHGDYCSGDDCCCVDLHPSGGAGSSSPDATAHAERLRQHGQWSDSGVTPPETLWADIATAADLLEAQARRIDELKAVAELRLNHWVAARDKLDELLAGIRAAIDGLPDVARARESRAALWALLGEDGSAATESG